MLDLYDEFSTLIGALEAAGVEYAVCGGLAMAVHGFPRATIDVDLVVPPNAAEHVFACARDLDYTIPAHTMSFAGGAVEIRCVTKINAVPQPRVISKRPASGIRTFEKFEEPRRLSQSTLGPGS
jgi:hypothetical protein